MSNALICRAAINHQATAARAGILDSGRDSELKLRVSHIITRIKWLIFHSVSHVLDDCAQPWVYVSVLSIFKLGQAKL